MSDGEASEAWIAAGDPGIMLDMAPDHVSDRKLRLFACACVRRVWGLLADARSGKAGVRTQGMPPPCKTCDQSGTVDLPWLTPAIRDVAGVIYRDRSPDGTLDRAGLLALSDMLEEAGCDDAGLLSHLRSPGPHFRGWWSLDLVLGKEAPS
jgi:hypothetical protein